MDKNNIKKIKIFNKRLPGQAGKKGSLFHYAHFICDCLFPEIVNGVYNYSLVIREASLGQTLGIFGSIYEDVTKTTNLELIPEEYEKIQIQTTYYADKWVYANKKSIEIFRDYIFTRYEIDRTIYNETYPEVLLIKRGKTESLINNLSLKSKLGKWGISNGVTRREIAGINELETYLNNRYVTNFKAVVLEKETFREQIQYFNNAKLIILAHGAAMSNMFFCKAGTIILEVVCNVRWAFFDEISKILELKHEKAYVNKVSSVIKRINEINLPDFTKRGRTA
jgi:hypothetical protein